MEEKFFTTEQVANILQVHPFTILKFIKEGKLKGIKLGRVYRIMESDIKNFLEERMTKPKKKKPQEEKVNSDQDLYEVPKDKKDDGDHYYII
jgi:excisionase family DNA binding protein